MANKIKQWDSDDLCPICKKEFKSDNCPHSIVEAEQRFNDNQLKLKIQKILKSELKK